MAAQSGLWTAPWNAGRDVAELGLVEMPNLLQGRLETMSVVQAYEEMDHTHRSMLGQDFAKGNPAVATAWRSGAITLDCGAGLFCSDDLASSPFCPRVRLAAYPPDFNVVYILLPKNLNTESRQRNIIFPLEAGFEAKTKPAILPQFL